MELLPRHQCLMYEGAPSRQLTAIAAAARSKLLQNHRCLYLNSPTMVAGMRSYLAMAGVDVTAEMLKGSLVLSSARRHLVDERFDVEAMMRTLNDALRQALDDGYEGLWATGDMTWEMGPETDYSRILDYEWRLEKFFQSHAELSGICQYRADLFPRYLLGQVVRVHPGIFLNETLSLVNPNYFHEERAPSEAGGCAWRPNFS